VKRTLALAVCVGCAHQAAPPARVSLAPRPVRAAPAVTAPARPSPAESSVFAFHAGDPAPVLHDYAVDSWGPNGPSTFTSPASVRRAGDLTLVLVGRYAVVEVPALGGFYYRDFGAAGWVTELGGDGRRVVARYTIRDGGADEDWRAWQHHAARVPTITSVTHMIVEVWSFSDVHRPRVVFAHEYEAWANCCGSEIGPAPPRIADDVDVTPTEVRLRAREAWRATAASWHESPLPGIDPVIAPWDSPRAALFPLSP
jgi:hypothetical protein